MTDNQEQFKQVCKAVNETPLLQSMLYDLNLLPEQTLDDPKRWGYTVSATMHMMEAIQGAQKVVDKVD